MKAGVKKTLVIFLLFFLTLIWGRDFFIRKALEAGVARVTGLPLQIQTFHMGIARTAIEIRGVRLLNPPGYPDPVMIDVPEVYVDYDLPKLLKGKIFLHEVRLNLREFVVVRNQHGDLNLDKLKELKPKSERPGAAGESPGPKLHIDTLDLRVGKVIFKDYAVTPPVVKEFAVDIHETHQNINDPKDLLRLLVFKALARTTIDSLVNFDLRSLRSSLPKFLQVTTQTTGNILKKATEYILREIVTTPSAE